MTARARRIRDLVGGLALGSSWRGAPPSRRRRCRPTSRWWIGQWEEQLEHVLVVELVVQNDQTPEVIAMYPRESRRTSV